MFDPDECALATVYCGSLKTLPKRKKNADSYYVRFGSPSECLKKGFGAGQAQERASKIDRLSLQNIKYVGEIYESRFIGKGINNIRDLAEFVKYQSSANINKLLTSIFKRKSNTGVDGRAFNSTLLFLYRSGNYNLPKCVNLLDVRSPPKSPATSKSRSTSPTHSRSSSPGKSPIRRTPVKKSKPKKKK